MSHEMLHQVGEKLHGRERSAALAKQACDLWPLTGDVDLKATLSTTVWKPGYKPTNPCAWCVVVGSFGGSVKLSPSSGARAAIPIRSGSVLPPPASSEGYYLLSGGDAWGTATFCEFADYDEAEAFAESLGHTWGHADNGGAIAGGVDVSLGAFVAGVAAVQVFLAGTNMPVGGALVPCTVIVNVDPNNAGSIYFSPTNPPAAFENVVGAAGQDAWNIPAGGKLWCLGSAATQNFGARVRS